MIQPAMATFSFRKHNIQSTVYTRGMTYHSEILENEELARWFLDEGADPNLGAPTYGSIQRDSPAIPNSGQALNSAACLPDHTMFDLLVERGAKLENCIALHYAAGSSRTDLERISMMTHLIDLGFDANELDDIAGAYKRGTPLHYAVRSKKLESIRFLLERGADPHLQNQWGETAAEEAVKRGYAEAVELFESETSWVVFPKKGPSGEMR